MQKVIFGAIILAVIVGVVIAMRSPSVADSQAACTGQGFSWDGEENTCVFGMAQKDENKQWCSKAGGKYNDCLPNTCPKGTDCLAVCIAGCTF